MEQWETGIRQLKAAYNAWNETKGGSIDTWLKLFADEVDFRSLANGQLGVPWTKTRTSPKGVGEYLGGQRLRSEWITSPWIATSAKAIRSSRSGRRRGITKYRGSGSIRQRSTSGASRMAKPSPSLNTTTPPMSLKLPPPEQRWWA
jgi:hypothetical protein